MRARMLGTGPAVYRPEGLRRSGGDAGKGRAGASGRWGQLLG